MHLTTRIILAAAFFLLSMMPFSVTATPISIAVASNFAPAIRDIAEQFELQSGQSVRIISASTGKLYAQIINGAPFDALFAADSERPRLLEAAGQGVAGSRFTYAIGHLVLWSRNPTLSKPNCRKQLEDLGRQRLAIANPAIAPYGMAARETLISLDLWDRVESQLVVGENITQTLQFVSSGNAILGFIAGTQALDTRLPEATCNWSVPQELHQPIEQQAIILQRATGNSVATSFMNFMRSSAGRTIIQRHGYILPAE